MADATAFAKLRTSSTSPWLEENAIPGAAQHRPVAPTLNPE